LDRIGWLDPKPPRRPFSWHQDGLTPGKAKRLSASRDVNASIDYANLGVLLGRIEIDEEFRALHSSSHVWGSDVEWMPKWAEEP
jgi:hypothetical protein